MHTEGGEPGELVRRAGLGHTGSWRMCQGARIFILNVTEGLCWVLSRGEGPGNIIDFLGGKALHPTCSTPRVATACNPDHGSFELAGAPADSI